ncbi:zinc-dependent alcohol dehydrogenase [Pseudonocardia kunmingensis]|uniref:Threonine dehydrogenase-like Zn-dependent dehydrogenase n=1 Tax=Pseudonocardia kunmingensis TaxID=630975 RepID=A0A543CX73_9PSEU|nr:alcohol dehydrogenase catalytic domain-containing protein [Pseudonocardia kunmingensis]TQM01639.1 threonine dehydrogenase-like Zn-dependent dehydrogenase [Pseudonocardia kunmingensis]
MSEVTHQATPVPDRGARVRTGGEVVALVAARTLQVQQRPVPQVGPDEVLLAPAAVGICGTDVHVWRGRTDTLPVVLTHDGVAWVTAVGDRVDRALLGRRVVVDPVDSCGSCAACDRYRNGICPRGGYLGLTVDGLLAEHVAMPASRVVPLPASVDDVDATVLEPVAIGLRIADEAPHWGLIPQTAVMIGGGPLGVLAGVVLRERGWDVRVVEPQRSRRAVAERLGLTPVAVADARAAGPAEMVVETSATEAGGTLAMEVAAAGAAIVVLGRSPGMLPSSQVLLRELTVVGLRGAPGRYADAVRLVTDGTVRPSAVVSHEFEPDEVTAAFVAHDQPAPPFRAVLQR